jgi:ribonucleoside-diphosphate reductase beta chain
MTDSIFNAHNTEWRDGTGSLFMGQQPALHDTINVRYPTIANIAQRQVSQRWTFDFINHQQSRMDLLGCSKNAYTVTLMNLAYQWEVDSIASRAIAPLFAPFVTNSELWEALLENSNMEVTHAKTYSEIVRQCVPDPNEVFRMVMENERTLKRSEAVAKVFRNLQVMGSTYNLMKAGIKLPVMPTEQQMYNAVFLGTVALWGLEKIQFMSSFPATFAVVDQVGLQSIGFSVQKIMLDELFCHAALDAEVIRIELQTERGQRALQMLRGQIKQLLDEIVDSEVQWGPYLFSEGRSILGLTAGLLTDHTRFEAQPVYDQLGIKFDWKRIENPPLPWMGNWINIDKTQNAQQENNGNNYALNVVVDDLGDEPLVFDIHEGY